MLKLFFSLACILVVTADTLSDRCNLCLDIATRAKKVGTDDEATTRSKATFAAYEYFGTQRETYYDELNCHWDKYYADANTPLLEGTTPLTTCADTGFCPLSNQLTNYSMVDITNTTHNYNSVCVVPKIILIHDTEIPTDEGTISSFSKSGLSVTYIVGVNGTIYQFVNDWNRAWHAGAGSWREVSNVNSHSCGIEIVSSGVDPFNQQQMDSVNMLVDTLKKRWHIRDDYVVAHSEITPARKQDPSVYFDWQQLDDYIKIQPGIYDSKLTPTEKSQVLVDNTTTDSSRIAQIQKNLFQWGYSFINMTNGIWDENTKLTVQAFNRRYAPEVFIAEVIIDGDTELRKENQRWYAISEERMNKLMALLSN